MARDLLLEETAEGVVIPVRAQPRARQNGIVGLHDGCLKVAVTEVPEKGKANAAIIKVLAKTLDLRRSQLKLIAGATTNRKRVLVQNVRLVDLLQRVEAALEG